MGDLIRVAINIGIAVIVLTAILALFDIPEIYPEIEKYWDDFLDIITRFTGVFRYILGGTLTYLILFSGATMLTIKLAVSIYGLFKKYTKVL